MALITLLAVSCRNSGALAGESWTLTFDNDSYSFEDGNYTNGTALSWQSAEIGSYEPTSHVRRAGESLGFWAPTDARYVSLTLGQLTFTPENIRLENPPEDAHPYAGIVFLDLGVHARGENDLTSVTLRVGAVGSASFAEETQTELHEVFGADDPKGWSHQLRDEALLNLGVEHHRRVAGGRIGTLLEWDVTPNIGAAAGTFFTGANVGLEVRVGRGLRQSIGSLKMMFGFETNPVRSDAASDGTTAYVFGGVEGYGIAHFLPIDGNVFQDSRSTTAEPWVGSGSVGFAVQRGPLGVLVSFTRVSDTYESQRNRGQFGTISLSWSP